MIDHRSPTWFSTGVPVRAMRQSAVQRARGLRLLGLRVLDVLRLVEDHAGPARPRCSSVEVAVQQRVAGEDEGVLARPASRSRRPRRAPGRGGPARAGPGVKRAASFCQLPTTDVGQTSSDRAARGRRVQSRCDEGERLDRLAQAHVVGQAGAEAPAAEEARATSSRAPGRAAACPRSPAGGAQLLERGLALRAGAGGRRPSPWPRTPSKRQGGAERRARPAPCATTSRTVRRRGPSPSRSASAASDLLGARPAPTGRAPAPAAS